MLQEDLDKIDLEQAWFKGLGPTCINTLIYIYSLKYKLSEKVLSIICKFYNTYTRMVFSSKRWDHFYIEEKGTKNLIIVLQSRILQVLFLF